MVTGKAIPAKSAVAGIGLLLWATAALIAHSGISEAPAPSAEITITGKEEIVFDHASQACEPPDIPDAPAHAFRDAVGNIQLLTAHYITYRMIGPDFNHLKKDCSEPAMRSDHDADPSKFEDNEWLISPYTLDGKVVYAIMHDEYHPWEHKTPPFDDATFCGVPAAIRAAECWYNAITYAVSTDGGKTYTHPTPPRHLVAEMPYRYQPRMGKTGIFAPSNIVRNKADGFFYVFAYSLLENLGKTRHLCAMRTQNLADPKSWRGWDGSGFGSVFKDPYVENIADPEKATCGPVQGINMARSVVYNTYLKKWVAVGDDVRWVNSERVAGFYSSVSDDLLHWSEPKLVLATPLFEATTLAYPSLIDHTDTSANFENSGEHAYLYYTSWQRFSRWARNLVRVPITVSAKN
jgi:hypothetical protein